MKKEVNRYTLNLVIGGKNVPYATSTLENIDLLFSNCRDKNEQIELFDVKDLDGHDVPIEDVVITYIVEQRTKITNPLVSSQRQIVTDYEKIPDKIKKHLDHKHIKSLKAINIHSDFVREKFFHLRNIKYISDYDYYLNKLIQQIRNEYNHGRDFALFLENQEGSFLEPSDHVRDNQEILDCFSKMEIFKQTEVNIQVNACQKKDSIDQGNQLSFFSPQPSALKTDDQESYYSIDEMTSDDEKRYDPRFDYSIDKATPKNIASLSPEDLFGYGYDLDDLERLKHSLKTNIDGLGDSRGKKR